jgi:hypothetical protein
LPHLLAKNKEKHQVIKGKCRPHKILFFSIINVITTPSFPPRLSLDCVNERSTTGITSGAAHEFTPVFSKVVGLLFSIVFKLITKTNKNDKETNNGQENTAKMF